MSEENKNFNLEEILSEVQADAESEVTAAAELPEETAIDDAPNTEEPIVIPKRPVFELHLNLDDEYGEIPEPVQTEEQTEVAGDTAPVHIYDEEPDEVHTIKPERKEIAGIGCFKALIYALIVLLVSSALALSILAVVIDFAAFTRSNDTVDIIVPENATTQQMAKILRESGCIQNEWLFDLYIGFADAHDGWIAGEFTVTKDLGYQGLRKLLQSGVPRETIKVTFPEGFTTKQIAERLEKNGVCTEEDFYRALREGDYSDYDFVAELSEIKPEDYDARIYKLEGYLFPDTYEFYVGCTGETVVRRMLDNFENRFGTSIRVAMKTKGITMDELVILASIVQGEAASKKDMEKVARVLWNRLENKDKFPKLQCDSTGDYIGRIYGSDAVSNKDYDTYVRDGLPVGAINNPGMDAVMAILVPSEDATIQKCFYFATDYDDGKTYYSKTLAEHEWICKKHGIGMYG